MKVLNVGLIKGRHNLPVEFYVYNEIKDVTDVETIEKEAVRFFEMNKADIYYIYVTGLTIALTSVIKAFVDVNKKDSALILMHYDRESNGYFEQPLFVNGN